MLLNKKNLINIMIIGLMVASCSYQIEKGKAPFVVTQLGGLTEESKFEEIKQSIFAPHCFRCHSDAGGNARGINLEKFEKVKPIADKILVSVENNRMPKRSAPLSDEEKRILREWVKSLKVVEPEPKPAPIPAPLFTYEKINKDVLQPSCIGCHSSDPSNETGVNLETYANVKELKDKIVDAVESGRMPEDGPLTDIQKEALLLWIKTGMAEK